MFSVPFTEFSQTYVQDCVTYWYNAKERRLGQQKRKAHCKAAFPLIYILIINILSANKIIYKWPHLHIKTQIHKQLLVNKVI